MKNESNTNEKNDRAVSTAFVEEEIVPHANQYDQEERVTAGTISELAWQG